MLVKFVQKTYLWPRVFEKGKTYDVDITVFEACSPCCVVVESLEDVSVEKKYKANFSIEKRTFFPNDGYGRLNRYVKSIFEFEKDSDIYVYFTTPYIFGIMPKDILNNKKIVLYTMFEGDKLPKCWVDMMAQFCKAIIVPSTFCYKVYRKEKKLKDIPIYVVPLFTEKFENLKPEPAEDIFYFGMENAFIEGKQKGWDIVIEAFEKLNFPNAKLLLKGRLAHYAYVEKEWIERAKKNPNIEVVIEDYNDQQMIDLFYKKIDCFVYPSRGEGFGLPPLQAMGFGIPTIVTNGHGMKDFARYGVPIRVKSRDYPVYYVNRIDDNTQGIMWVKPNFSDLIFQMTNVYNNFNYHKHRAVANMLKLKNRFSLEAFVKNLVDVIDQYKLSL